MGYSYINHSVLKMRLDRLEPIPPIEMTIKITDHDLYNIISCLEKHALDERIIGNNDNARKIAKIIMKLEEQKNQKL